MRLLRSSLLLLLFAGAMPAQADDTTISAPELLREAGVAYRNGLALRFDARQAVPQFRRAAQLYDRFWDAGFVNPALGQQRGHAHRLAGEIGHAVQAYREGLRIAPADADLQKALDDVREQVEYPVGGMLAEQAKPQEAPAWFRQLTWAKLGPLVFACYCVICLALARAWMSRRRWWVWLSIVAALVAIGLVLAIQRAESEADARRQTPGIVIDEPGTPLFTGNGDHYPKRFDRLPPGVEAEVLTRRGEWLQIRLAGGTIGWIPSRVALTVG